MTKANTDIGAFEALHRLGVGIQCTSEHPPSDGLRSSIGSALTKLMEDRGYNDLKKHWHRREIPKGPDDVRVVYEASDVMRPVSDALAKFFSYGYSSDATIGFRAGVDHKDIIALTLSELEEAPTEAWSIDLEDFFPSVHRGMVHGVVRGMTQRLLGDWQKGPGYTHETCDEVADMMTDFCVHHGRLPQGAPTSPAITNMVMLRLDTIILDEAAKYGVKFLRYADDMMFITDREEGIPEAFKQFVVDLLTGRIPALNATQKFKINEGKTDGQTFEQPGDSYEFLGCEIFAGGPEDQHNNGKPYFLAEKEKVEEVREELEKQLSLGEKAKISDIRSCIGGVQNIARITISGSEENVVSRGSEHDEAYALPVELNDLWHEFKTRFELDAAYTQKPATGNDVEGDYIHANEWNVASPVIHEHKRSLPTDLTQSAFISRAQGILQNRGTFNRIDESSPLRANEDQYQHYTATAKALITTIENSINLFEDPVMSEVNHDYDSFSLDDIVRMMDLLLLSLTQASIVRFRQNRVRRGHSMTIPREFEEPFSRLCQKIRDHREFDGEPETVDQEEAQTQRGITIGKILEGTSKLFSNTDQKSYISRRNTPNGPKVPQTHIEPEQLTGNFPKSRWNPYVGEDHSWSFAESHE